MDHSYLEPLCYLFTNSVSGIVALNGTYGEGEWQIHSGCSA